MGLIFFYEGDETLLCFCFPVPDMSFPSGGRCVPWWRNLCLKKKELLRKTAPFFILFLDSCEFQYLFDCRIQSVGILATGSCEVGLTAATALNQFGSFFHQVTGF